MLLEQHLMPDYTQPPHPWPHKHTHPFDLLFCPTMVSLRLSVQQSDIFKDFIYLSLTWIKPFSMQFAEESTNFEKVDNLPIMPLLDVCNFENWIGMNLKDELHKLYIILRLLPLFWLAVTYHQAERKRGNLSAHVP